jgi:hypothetical protein
MSFVFIFFLFVLNSFAATSDKALVKPVNTTKASTPIVATPAQASPKNNYVEKINKGAQKATDFGKKSFEKINALQKQTTLLRGQRPHNIMATYSGPATWIPGKLGISYTYSPTTIGSWELSYARGKISAPYFIDDIGSVSDSHLSLLYRSYSRRNSFSFIYGLNYYKFDARLSGQYLSSISSGNPQDYNLLSVRSLGVTLGIGNRWQLKNGMSVGIDWIHLNIPVSVFKTEADYLSSDADQSDKNDIENVLDILKRVPTFALFKLQVGYTF